MIRWNESNENEFSKCAAAYVAVDKSSLSRNIYFVLIMCRPATSASTIQIILLRNIYCCWRTAFAETIILFNVSLKPTQAIFTQPNPLPMTPKPLEVKLIQFFLTEVGDTQRMTATAFEDFI